MVHGSRSSQGIMAGSQVPALQYPPTMQELPCHCSRKQRLSSSAETASQTPRQYRLTGFQFNRPKVVRIVRHVGRGYS